MIQCQALWYTERGRIELRRTALPPPEEGHVVIKAHYSGVSRGTERLIHQGLIPRSEYQRMRCPYQEGEFPNSVKYGYALTGEIMDGPRKSIGKKVFVLHPHQSFAKVDAAHVHQIPDGLPLRRAALAANMETAVNVIWDTAPSPGERILIIGGGVLGLLIAGLITISGRNEVTITDKNPARASIAQLLGAKFTLPKIAPNEQQVIIHTSATEIGLRQALNHAASDGRIVEASWFGNREITLPLGESFHSKRLRLISSQVGAIPPSHRDQWTFAKRMQKALAHLEDERFDALITGEINFDDAPTTLPNALTNDSSGLMTVLHYL
ncbi:MAG: dehydrogenase [Candidatus Marinimicrobia bacterium]|nr:dehydrogenase [Candidatus Neomarinimicrobiota bacterium]